MTRRILTLAALLTLSATPALAGLADEVAHESTTPVRMIANEPEAKGYGSLVTSEADGRLESAAIEAVEVASYPESERPKFDRGQ
jgi:hypothetical protein